MSEPARDLPPDPAADDAYALFQRGVSLLESDHWAQAAVSLEKAKRLEPDKTSIREALGRAYFHSGRYRQGGERVLRGGRALPGQRLRALLPRPLVREARRPQQPPAGTCLSPPACAPIAPTTASTETACAPPGAAVRALVQRVSEASVSVDGVTVGAIGPGLVVLLGVGRR